MAFVPKVNKPGTSDPPGVNGKKVRAWPVVDDDEKDLEEPTAMLRVRFPEHIMDSMQARGLPIQTILNKTLIRSGISAATGMEEAYKGGEAWYIDPHPDFKSDLVFKANKALVLAIVTDRDTKARPFHCGPGKLTCGAYATQVYFKKTPLKPDYQVPFGHNTVMPLYVRVPSVLKAMLKQSADAYAAKNAKK